MTSENIGYGSKTHVEMDFADALDRVREALRGEGFGVITEIDMKEKFKEKLGKEFPNYVILGACNPGFAYDALGEDSDIGLLLPCNVAVYQDQSKTAVSILDAEKALSLTGNDQMKAMSQTVNYKLRRVLDSL
jgi:uncharacterized protein (DUF302 family)